MLYEISTHAQCHRVREKLIEQWKVMEKEWLEKVVDIKQHEDLVSPYETNQEKGG